MRRLGLLNFWAIFEFLQNLACILDLSLVLLDKHVDKPELLLYGECKWLIGKDFICVA